MYDLSCVSFFFPVACKGVEFTLASLMRAEGFGRSGSASVFRRELVSVFDWVLLLILFESSRKFAILVTSDADPFSSRKTRKITSASV